MVEVLQFKKLTRMALLTAIALTIFVLEAQLPVAAIPGMKLGLANIITVYAVFVIGSREAASILFCRIFLGAVFAGNFATIFYSLAGGTLALLVSALLRKVITHKQIWIAGALAAIAHSIGQMLIAILFMATVYVLFYLPVLILTSLFAGVFTGLCAQFMINRGKNLWKTTSK